MISGGCQYLFDIERAGHSKILEFFKRTFRTRKWHRWIARAKLSSRGPYRRGEMQWLGEKTPIYWVKVL